MGQRPWRTELRRLAQHAGSEAVNRVEELAAHVAQQHGLMVFERHGVAHQSKDDACVPDQVGQEQVDGHPAGRDVVVCV